MQKMPLALAEQWNNFNEQWNRTMNNETKQWSNETVGWTMKHQWNKKYMKYRGVSSDTWELHNEIKYTKHQSPKQGKILAIKKKTKIRNINDGCYEVFIRKLRFEIFFDTILSLEGKKWTYFKDGFEVATDREAMASTASDSISFCLCEPLSEQRISDNVVLTLVQYSAEEFTQKKAHWVICESLLQMDERSTMAYSHKYPKLHPLLTV